MKLGKVTSLAWKRGCATGAEFILKFLGLGSDAVHHVTAQLEYNPPTISEVFQQFITANCQE